MEVGDGEVAPPISNLDSVFKVTTNTKIVDLQKAIISAGTKRHLSLSDHTRCMLHLFEKKATLIDASERGTKRL